MFNMKKLLNEARRRQRIIVYPEAGFSDRIIEAVKVLNKKKIVKPILIGDESSLIVRHKELSGFTIINPKTSALREKFIKKLKKKLKNLCLIHTTLQRFWLMKGLQMVWLEEQSVPRLET